MQSPFLTDIEIAEMCEGLTQPAAMVAFLRGLGLHVEQKPNRRPLVVRSHAEAVLSGRLKAEQGTNPTLSPSEQPQKPDKAALVYLLNRGKNGPKEKKQSAQSA